MYEELVKALHEGAEFLECSTPGIKNSFAKMCHNAADAIEEMQGKLFMMKKTAEWLAEKVPQWIPFKTRPMDAEEREYYREHHGYDLTDDEAVIYCCPLPEHGQEVLVCNELGRIWIDTFDDDPDYGIGFEENGDMDGLVAWMPRPKPYEPQKEG